MGNIFEKVTVYCPVSGCTPQILLELPPYLTDNRIGPLVMRALEELVLEDTGMKDVTVVGDIDGYTQQVADSNPHTPRFSMPRADALATPDSAVCVLRHCRAGPGVELWDLGVVGGPAAGGGHDDGYLVAAGALVMVQTCALPILRLATRGRVTPLRLWRVAMHQGWSATAARSDGAYGLAGVEYGAVEHERTTHPSPVPWMTPGEVGALEELGSVEAIKEVIMHRGGLWMWMSPDGFPLESAAGEEAVSIVSSESLPPKHDLAMLEELPFELLCAIASEGPLSSLLFLASTSRAMRAMLLGSEGDRNAIASAWIIKSAPWYIPVDNSDEETPRKFAMGKVSDPWAYVRRCRASASMRNRERIWRVAEQIEERAERCEV